MRQEDGGSNEQLEDEVRAARRARVFSVLRLPRKRTLHTDFFVSSVSILFLCLSKALQFKGIPGRFLWTASEATLSEKTYFFFSLSLFGEALQQQGEVITGCCRVFVSLSFSSSESDSPADAALVASTPRGRQDLEDQTAALTRTP